MKDGTMALVVSAPSYRDTIYVGYVYRHGDMLEIKRATMVVYYETVATAGLSGAPDMATTKRQTSGRPVWIPLRSVAQILEVDEAKWIEHLPVEVKP